MPVEFLFKTISLVPSFWTTPFTFGTWKLGIWLPKAATDPRTITYLGLLLGSSSKWLFIPLALTFCNNFISITTLCEMKIYTLFTPCSSMPIKMPLTQTYLLLETPFCIQEPTETASVTVIRCWYHMTRSSDFFVSRTHSTCGITMFHTCQLDLITWTSLMTAGPQHPYGSLSPTPTFFSGMKGIVDPTVAYKAVQKHVWPI